MSLTFFKIDAPYKSELERVGVVTAFIIYDDASFETAFFNVADDDIVPFNAQQMEIVNRQYKAWCVANSLHLKDFNIEAHREFMRGL